MALLDSHQFTIAIPGIITAFIALCASIYICLSVLMMKRLRMKQQNARQEPMSRSAKYSALTMSMSTHQIVFWEKPDRIIFEHYIFWMAFCDALAVIGRIFVLTPWLWKSTILMDNPKGCQIIGAWCQFFYVAGCIWYSVIAWCLFKIIFGIETKSIEKSKLLHTFLTWLITIILTAVPMLGNAYGSIDNYGSGYYVECWIKSGPYILTLYATIILTNLFALFLLFSFTLRKCVEKGCCHNVSIRENIIRYKRRKNKRYKSGEKDALSLKRSSFSDKLLTLSTKLKGGNKKLGGHYNSLQEQEQEESFNSEITSNISLSHSSVTQSVIVYELNDNKYCSLQNCCHCCCGCCCFLCDENRYFGMTQTVQDKEISLRLIQFSLAYMTVWLVPITMRMYEYSTQNDLKIWQLSIMDICLSSIGIANAIVWMKSKNFLSYTKVKSVLHENQQIEDVTKIKKTLNTLL